MSDYVREMTFEEETAYYEAEARAEFAKENNSGSDSSSVNNILRRGMRIIRKARQKIEELEETVVHQRNRAGTAEDFVCKLCAECEWEENDGISTMIKKCCNWFPECKQFKIRSRWIPVTARLPEVGGSYLVVLKYKYDFEKEYTYDTDVATFYFDDSGNIDNHWATYNDWDEGQQYLHVTHWMPLPEPPQEG